MKLIRSKNTSKLSNPIKNEMKVDALCHDFPNSVLAMNPSDDLDSINWKVLIVDDEPDVHEVTRIGLKRFTFDGKNIELVSVYSAEQARKILQNNQDFAVAMIDVVMETEEAGLDLVRFIRKEVGLSHIRLIIRTGQPGKAPERFVIDNFDIDDYKEKTDLTALKMYTVFRSLIKSYRDILTIERSKIELEHKVKERTQELYQANKELEEISLTDVLTKLPNRRHALQQLKTYWDESKQTGNPISLMMIDADNFKAVNDTYGHDAGDHVLCELSKILQHSVRTDDLVSRLGGDEFLIICPNTNKVGGLQIADTVRKNVSKIRVQTGDGHWQGSVSVGFSVRNEDMDSFESLIKSADEGVYAAKRDGKNCVRVS